MAEYRHGVPAPVLRGLVDSYHGYRMAGFPPGVHRGMPSRHVTVVVALDGPVLMNVPGPLALDALAGGLHDRAVVMRHPGHQFGVQLGLTPPGAARLLGVPAGELAREVLPLDALLGPAAAELADRLATAAGWPERFAALDDVLGRCLGDRGPAGSPEVGHAWRRLLATGGTQPVHALAAEVGWSRRHLAERFRREIGLPPKLAARILRFERSREELLRGGGRARLADVAAGCGYADQAHLTREWNDLAGCPPSAWLAEELPILQDAAGPVPAGSAA